MALAGDHVQVLVAGYELTGDLNRISIPDTYAMHDVTAFSDGAHKFIQGQRTISLEHLGFLNSAAAGSHPVLKGNALEGVVSVILGQNAAPVAGDPMHSLFIVQGKYGTMPEFEQYIPFSAMFANNGDLGGWGVALTPPVSFTNTTNGSSVDNSAASSQGGAAFLHVLQAAASDTYTIIIEGSTTGAFAGEQTTLTTFALNASALGSERKAISGTIPRYTRFKATRSGSAGNTVKLAVNLVRF